MDILVNVVNQKLKVSTNRKSFVAGTREFIKFVFDLSDDWKGLLTFVQFQQKNANYNVYLNSNNEAFLPSEIQSGILTIVLQGNLGNVIAKSYPLDFVVDIDPIKPEGENFEPEITLSVYEQLTQKIEEIEVECEKSHMDLSDKIIELEEKIANISTGEIEKIAINSFSCSPNSAEKGSAVNKVTLTWSTSITPVSITIDGENQTATASGSVTKSNLNVTSNKTFSLVATDSNGNKATRSASLNFLNGVYYGVSESPESINSDFILSLTKNLRSSKLSSFTVNAGEEQYIYYCLPVSMGTCSFSVGGFIGGFSLVNTISFTNSSGHTENYYVYKSDNANLGKTTVSVT